MIFSFNKIRPKEQFIKYRNPLLIVLFIILTVLNIASRIVKVDVVHSLSNLSANIPTKQLAGNFDLKDIRSFKGLPVTSIKYYDVPNSKGTVIFIPQYHLNPGSSSDDSKNDSAQKNQEEIFKILENLHQKFNIELVMMEGELFGEVPVDKIALIASKVEKRNDLAASCELLEKAFNKQSLSPSVEKSLLKGVDQQIAKTDREILLAGAPLKLKIENSTGNNNVILYGSENKDTQDESRVVVRDYIYLQDRMDQLNNLSRVGQSTSNSSNSSLRTANTLSLGNNGDNWLNLLEKLISYDPLGGAFRTLESIAISKGNTDLGDLLKKTESLYSDLAEGGKIQIASSSNASAGPSRSDNPYSSMIDKTQINNLMKQDEEKINSIVIDRRNRETAENFAKALNLENKKIGILQFGAGYEQGMVEELKKQGLSVVVITSSEVSKRNSQQN